MTKSNKQVARVLKSTADLVELTGGNPFRARAFAAAARAIEDLEEPVDRMLASGALTGVKGIGKGIAADIGSILDRGSFEARDQMLSHVPPGLPDLLRVRGLGVKRVRTLWTELGITSLEELEDALAAGQINRLDGFSEKSERQLAEQVRLTRAYRARRRFHAAYRDAEPLLEALRACEEVEHAEAVGEYRRRMETVAAVEIVVAGEEDTVRRVAGAYADESEPVQDDPPFFEGRLPDGLPVRIFRVEASRFWGEVWRRTGSTAHVRAFAERHGEPADADSEEAFYERAGLSWVPPELREGDGELDAAAAGTLPRLIEVSDLRGTLHNHTTFSDGAHTLREMATAARGMGLQYIGICDHSRSLAIARGLTIERLEEQIEQIEALNEEFAADGGLPFRIFCGTECDILPDGSLDFPDHVLARLDIVVASIHQNFEMTEDQATVRLIRAVSNPHVSILGHPTARLLLAREGYPVDHRSVIAACAEHDVAIELNANPYRLDMDWRYVRDATTAGVLIAINPDAHSREELDNVRWGVAVARKGWLTREQCLNARTAGELAAWLEARRTRQLAGAG